MRKEDKTLRIILIFSVSVSSVFGQTKVSDTTRISLEEINVTASRIPEKARQLIKINRIVSHQEIESSPTHYLEELLEYIPDLDIRQRGPGGVQADISFRGGSFDQTSVLVNGINFNDPQTGHFQLDIPIPLTMIQQIEVLPCSDVKSLGSNALAGAINIVTGIPKGKKVHASLTGGQNGYLETSINSSNRSPKWWQQSGILYSRCDGYRVNTDYNKLNGFFQSGYTHRRFEVSLMAGGLKKAFGANSFYTLKYPNQYERTGSGFAYLQAVYKGKLNLSESIYYRIHTDEFSLFRWDPPEWYKSPNYHLSQIAGCKSDAWFTSALGKTSLEFEFRHESIWSTVLGDLTEKTKPITGVDGTVYNHFGSRSHLSLSAENQLITGFVTWNGGIVLHEIQATKNYFQVYPGLDISISLPANWRTYISLDRAFRLPSFTELYYQSPTNSGNSNLLPETAWNAETGIEYQKGGLTFKMLGFYRYATQSIDWVRNKEQEIWHAENLGRISTWGLETGLNWTPLKDLTASKIIERFEFGYRYYFQHHGVENYDSQYVLDYLKWKMTAGVTLKIGKPFRITACFVWQERNGTYTSFDAVQNMIEVDYKPFATIDLKLAYNFKAITFIAECSNILNTEYFDLGGIPQPGTWFKAGFELNLVGRN